MTCKFNPLESTLEPGTLQSCPVCGHLVVIGEPHADYGVPPTAEEEDTINRIIDRRKTVEAKMLKKTVAESIAETVAAHQETLKENKARWDAMDL